MAFPNKKLKNTRRIAIRRSFLFNYNILYKKQKSEHITINDNVRIILVWWRYGDSNPRPFDCQSNALANCAIPPSKYYLNRFACACQQFSLRISVALWEKEVIMEEVNFGRNAVWRFIFIRAPAGMAGATLR